MTDTKPEPREAHIVHNDYQPSKAQLEADARVEATFPQRAGLARVRNRDQIQASARPVHGEILPGSGVEHLLVLGGFSRTQPTREDKMFGETKKRGTVAAGILSDHGLSKEDIQELSDYMDSRIREYTRPIWITFTFALVAILTLPDQALIVGLKLLFSMIS